MDKIIEWFGSGNYESNLERIESFWNGSSNERYLISINTKEHDYRQIFNAELLVENAVKNLAVQATVAGCNMPTFFPDFGTVSTAEYWGGETYFPDETSPNLFIKTVAENIDDALALVPLSLKTAELPVMKALSLFQTINKKLNSNTLWLRTPDFQGVLNTAGLVMNQEELFMAMFTDPDKVHQFLDNIYLFLVNYYKALQIGSGNKICGNIWPFVFTTSNTAISFTEDMMPLLSPEMYKEFGIPYLERFSTEFGSLIIHCCGEWGRHVKNIVDSDAKIKAVEFHYPYTSIEELEPLSEEIVLIPYVDVKQANVEFNSVLEYYDYLLDNFGNSRRFWFAFPEVDDDALKFIEKRNFRLDL